MKAHIRRLLGGATRTINGSVLHHFFVAHACRWFPDITKTGVNKPCRYDPDIDPTYRSFAAHYGFGVLPARPYKPRDKAVIENAVQAARRWMWRRYKALQRSPHQFSFKARDTIN
jgi:transposase